MASEGSEAARDPREVSSSEVHEMAKRGVRIGRTSGVLRAWMCVMREWVAEIDDAAEGSM